MHKPSMWGRNRCCAKRKRVLGGSLSLMMTSREECRWVVLRQGVDFVGHQELFRTRRCMDNSGQEDCGEWTKLKSRPEERDAWTNLFESVVTNEQKLKIYPENPDA